MRVVATVLPGLGHLNPMVPLLREMTQRGHEVEVAVPPPFVPYVERAGLRATGIGPAWTEMDMEDVHPGWHELDGPAQLRVWTEFATRFEPHLAKYVESVQPDVIVHDHFEFAGWLVGERLGIPWVPYAMTVRALDPVLIALCEAGDAVDSMREAAGLAPDGGKGGGGRWLYLDALPPSLTADLMPPGPTVHHVRHLADDRTAGTAELPPIVTDRPQGRDLVYLTLGTIFNRSQEVLENLVAGAGRVDADVLVTIGENGVPPTSIPSNVTVERYVPQVDLYPSLSAVICHAGFGTAFGALSHGLPVGCAPIAADQSVNAALIAEAGAGCNLATQVNPGALFPVLQPGEPAPEHVADALERLLHEPELRTGARALAAELATGASPAAAANLVERVVTTGQPILRD